MPLLDMAMKIKQKQTTYVMFPFMSPKVFLVRHILDWPTQFHFEPVYCTIMMAVFKKMWWVTNIQNLFISCLTMPFNANSWERLWNRPISVFHYKSITQMSLLMYELFAFHCFWVILFLFDYPIKCRKLNAMLFIFPWKYK